MARWRLRTGHYLNILNPNTNQPITWEYSETDRNTGETDRKVFTVPKLLDPNDPKCHNHADGVVVCWEGKGERKDIIFYGNPTPDMEPYDEEAEAISQSFAGKWAHPIDTLPTNGAMLAPETLQIMEAFAKAIGAQAQPNVSVDGNADTIKAMQEQIARLEALVAVQVKPEAKAERRA